LSDFDEIWYTASDIEPGIQDGGGRHLENRFFGHNSLIECQISAKFCMRKQNGMLTGLSDKKCKCVKFKMADGHHFENR